MPENSILNPKNIPPVNCKKKRNERKINFTAINGMNDIQASHDFR